MRNPIVPAYRNDLVSAVQFAALEPLWAGVDAQKLRFLLVLGALFNQRLHVNDTQLIDNPHLIADFARTKDEAAGLYALLETLIREGIMAVSLRKANFLSSQEDLDPCHSLMDVLRSWERRSPGPTDWVTDPKVRNRREMLTNFDKTLSISTAPILSYDYVDIKRDFMSQVRREFATVGTVLNRLLSKQSSELRDQYEQIVARPWFTHSTTYALFRSESLPLDDPLMQLHGLFDEAAYAHWHQIDLFGSDWSTETTQMPEQVLGVSTMDSADVHVPNEELMHAAHRIVKSPIPELISQLDFEDILLLRRQAGKLFSLQKQLKYSKASQKGDEKALAETLADYWETIADHVQRAHPKPVSLVDIGIFSRRDLARHTPPRQHLSFGLTVNKVTADKSIPLSVESIFFASSAFVGKEEEPLFKSTPRRSWFTPDLRRLHQFS